MELHTGFKGVLGLMLLVQADLARYDALDARAVFVPDGRGRGEARVDFYAGGFGLLAEPGGDAREGDDVVALLRGEKSSI